MRTKKDLYAVVCDCILGALKIEASGITEKTDPIKDLGRDSFDGVEVAAELCLRLGIEIPFDVNPFVDDKKERSRCIGEIVELCLTYIQEKEGKSHD